jgi:hypothetical protein
MVDSSHKESGSQPERDNPCYELIKTMLLHVDNLFHQRVNIFLLAEAIFLTAFATAWGSEYNSIKYVLCVLALIFTVALWWPLHRLQVGFKFWRERFKSCEAIYKEYTERGEGAPGAGIVFVWLVPAATALSWIVLLFFI